MIIRRVSPRKLFKGGNYMRKYGILTTGLGDTRIFTNFCRFKGIFRGFFCVFTSLMMHSFFQEPKTALYFSFISNYKDFHDLSTGGKGGKTYTRCTMWIEFYICLGQTKALFALLMDSYYPKANFIWGSNYDMVGLDFISWGQKSLGREWGGRCVKQILQAGQIFTQKCQLFTIILTLEYIPHLHYMKLNW